MGVDYSEIQELLQQRVDIQASLNLMPYVWNKADDKAGNKSQAQSILF